AISTFPRHQQCRVTRCAVALLSPVSGGRLPRLNVISFLDTSRPSLHLVTFHSRTFNPCRVTLHPLTIHPQTIHPQFDFGSNYLKQAKRSSITELECDIMY